MEPKPDNLYKLSKERKTLRSTVEGEMSQANKELFQQELEDIETRIESWHIADEGGFSKAKERLRAERAETESNAIIDEETITAEIPDYPKIKALIEDGGRLKDFEMRLQMEMKAHPVAGDAFQRISAKARADRRKVQEETGLLEKDNPQAVRATELVEAKLNMSREGHIVVTDSVEKYLDQIGQRLFLGKAIFLHGPTGTGKTSLARLAAKRFTGKSPEMVYCNPQTRESSVWGKTGLRPAQGEAGAHGAIETVDIYGPLAKAMIEGKVVIFDEFTALPKEQQSFIKGIFNAKPGDEVNVVGNGKVTIKSGFQMIFTANLKSEKNPERQELPPEIAREFEQNNIKINYLPEHESYDVMLARLMDKDGSVTASWHDLNQTLPQFCSAMAEIQAAYTGVSNIDTARTIGRLDASGARPGLKKFVLTQGTIEAVFEAWKSHHQEDEHESFAAFLDRRLKIALTFEEYPLEDRKLAAQILASKGLLRTVTPADLNLPADTFNFDAAKKLRENSDMIAALNAESTQEVRVSLSELAELDPFHTRGQDTVAAARAFIKPQPAGAETAALAPEEIKTVFGGYLKKSYQESWGGSAEQVAQAGEKPEMRKPSDIVWENTTEVDAAKFGEFTMNPDTAGINWETIPPERIKVFDFKEFRGKKRWELAKYITTEWPERDRYLVPGIEYWKYVFEHQDEIPDSLKDGNWHYFFGSIFRATGGDWSVPVVGWNGSAFRRSRFWLTDGWNSDSRVVLLEK